MAQVELTHGYYASAYRNQPLAGVGVAVCARCVHPRPVPAPIHRRASVHPGCAPVVARTSAAAADLDPFSESAGGSVTRAGRLAAFWPVASALARGADAARVSAADRPERAASDQSTFAGAIARSPRRATARGRADGRNGSAGGLHGVQKKAPALTAPRARRWVGARSSRGRAAGSSVTRNTPCVCGCPRRIGR